MGRFVEVFVESNMAKLARHSPTQVPRTPRQMFSTCSRLSFFSDRMGDTFHAENAGGPPAFSQADNAVACKLHLNICVRDTLMMQFVISRTSRAKSALT